CCSRSDYSARGDARKCHDSYHRYVVQGRRPRDSRDRAPESKCRVHSIRSRRSDQLPARARALAATTATAGDQPACNSGRQQGGYARRGYWPGDGAGGGSCAYYER
ncbi:hypothetical protein IWW47_006238, partial [Coemansia sp. RSA 2052]